MKRLVQVISLGLSLAVAGSAAANQRGYDEDYGPQYETARVVRVDPIIERYDEPVSRDVCYNEPVERYEPTYAYVPGHRRDTTGSTILGALIGGALGNQVGKGDGRKAATIAGAVIGGSIGHDNARHHGRYYETGGRVSTGYEHRCDTRTDYRAREEVVGYDVSYEYHGRVYHTRTDYHPGSTIRVAVNVDAVP